MNNEWRYPNDVAQQVFAVAGLDGKSLVFAFRSANTAGNTIAIDILGETAEEPTVTDTMSNIYIRNRSAFFARNIAGGVNVVTAKFKGNAPESKAIAREIYREV